MFLWTRPVPPAWQAALEEIGGPPNARVPWLLLDWEPGELYAPVQRWVIYEMIPEARLRVSDPAATRDLFAALHGPPPRTLRVFTKRAIYALSAGVREADLPEDAVRAGSVITQRAWELWRVHRALARPFWVIQGRGGGHKRTLSPEEQMLMRQVGQPLAWPAPGDWAYAEWDRRVYDALAAQQRMLEMQSQMRDLERRTADHHVAERRILQRQIRERLLKWLDAQLHQQAEATRDLWRPSDLPRAPSITDEEFEAAEAAFINGG